MYTVISASSCLDLYVLQRYQLEGIYPSLVGRLVTKESTTGGYLLIFVGSAQEWEKITARPIKYDLSHLD